MAGVADTTTTSADAPVQSKKRAVLKAMKRIPAHKAREMLRDGTANGKPLTEKQKHLFGMIVGASEK